jgi:hypothetical protein
VSSEGIYQAAVVLPCDKQSWKIELKVDDKPPYLIESIWFNPAGRE